MPAVLHALERNADRIAKGEVWRVVTALVQQDGGLAGTIANALALLVMGSVAEHLLGGRRTADTFIGVGVLAQLPALAWQPVGAGNSVANFGLTGALALDVLFDCRRSVLATAAAAFTLLAGIGLTALTDVHGTCSTAWRRQPCNHSRGSCTALSVDAVDGSQRDEFACRPCEPVARCMSA